MAWPKDKKPYDPYAPGTPLVRAQTRMNQGVKEIAQGAARGTRSMAQGAKKTVSENLGGKYVRAAVTPALNRLSADAAGQSKVMAVEENKAKVKRNMAMAGDRRVPVSYNPPNPQYPSARQMLATPKPVNQPGPQQQPVTRASRGTPQVDNQLQAGEGWIRNEATGKTASYRGGRFSETPGTRQIPIARRNSPVQVGNMDVQFDNSVTPAARQAFLQNPVAPTAQMARFDANANTPRGRYFGAAKLEQDTPRKPETMGEMIMERFRMGQEKQSADIANQEANTGIAFDRNRIAEQGANQEFTLGSEGNAIDRMQAESAGRLQGVQTQAGEMELEQQGKLKALQDEYTATEDGERRKQLENQIRTLMGKPQDKFQIVTNKDVDAEGNPTQQNWMIDSDGNKQLIGGGEQEEMLPRDPSMRKVGKRYKHTDGLYYVWDGNGLKPANPSETE